MLSLNFIKKIMKEAGAERVSKEAQIELAKLVDGYVCKLSKSAVVHAGYFGRKTVKKEDINEI